MTLVHRSLNALLALWGLLHLHAAFYPSVLNWGVHHSAFKPGVLQWLVPVLMIAAAVPAVQTGCLRLFRHCLGACARLSAAERKLLLAGGFVATLAVFVILRASGILGDGLLLVNQLSLIRRPSDVLHVYPNEPLTGLLHWLAAGTFFGGVGVAPAELAYRSLSVASGAVFIAALFAAVRRIVPRPTERALAFLFVLAAAPTVLFFGYVENYSIAYAALMVFACAALAYLRGEVPVFAPAAAAAVMVPLYFGLMWFLPAVAWLLLVEWRRTGTPARSLAAGALFLVLLFGLLAPTGYWPQTLFEKLTTGGRHLVGLVPGSGEMADYTLLSFHHVADLLNFVLLISPAAAFLIAVLAAPALRRDGPRDPVTIFLLLMAVCGATLTALFLPELGMPRDWDLLSPMALGGLLLAPVLLQRAFPPGERRRQALIGCVAAAALHAVPWISLNHDPDAGISQFRMILNETTWIRNLHVGFEGLAMAAKRRGDYETAAGIYREFLKRDSTHARILGNLADVYRVLGREDSETVYYEKAVRYGSTVPAIYFNLGTIYASRGRYAEAVDVMGEGLRLEPGRADIVNAVGSFILRAGGSCREAMPLFQSAIRIDPRYALAYLNAGDCSGAIGDTSAMRSYLEAVVRIDPEVARRFDVRRRLGGLPPR
jgi:tetratricopeptide (TPR) repeat protein